MPVHLYRMLSGGIDELIFAVSRDRDRASGFARELPTINVFPAHVILPTKGSYTLVSGSVLHRSQTSQ
jgi:hypothetical protein